MTSVLLDVNVLLDVFLGRQPWLPDSAAVLLANQERRIVSYISAVTLPTIFYVVRRNASLAQAREVVGESLRSFEIIPVGRNTLELAHTLPGADFEDNLQIACAVGAGVDAIVTRDAAGFSASPLPVLTPAQLFTEFALEARSDE